MSDIPWVELGKQGRVVIPAHVRRQLGWDEGTKLAVRIKDGAVELLTRETAGRRLKEMFAGVDVSLSEELMAERRAEAAADAAEELAELERRARRP
jgi:AbrB family looped-hinge helix DNA binding protein